MKAIEQTSSSIFVDFRFLGNKEEIAFNPHQQKVYLLDFEKPVYVLRINNQVGLATSGKVIPANNINGNEPEVIGVLPAFTPQMWGNEDFKSTYRTSYSYYTGAMANGIASTNMVIALGKAGFMGSFGAAGLPPARLEEAIKAIQSELPYGPYAFNLIHSPNEDALERNAVNLYLKYQVRTVEASAFLDLSPSIVQYRATGLEIGKNGNVEIKNHIIAKVSRKEVALKFLHPAPAAMLQLLVNQGKISPDQARLASQVPMADDITIEADSGGHTDNRPLVCILPVMLSLRDEVQKQYAIPFHVRIGAAGGITTPSAVLAAFMMGADYVVTGTVNQACVESGASDHTRRLLAQAGFADVTMAPCADMFEMGVKVQVLKTGTLFPMRAQKLYDLYTRYDSIDAIPVEERDKLEKQVFKRSFDSVWDDTVKFFSERDPDQITRANSNPKRKMALIFRWYLGLSSRWSNTGEKGREMDYQIWCGPGIGSFNDWTKSTYLADYQSRHVVDIARHLLVGCCYLDRVQQLVRMGVKLQDGIDHYVPEKQLF